MLSAQSSAVVHVKPMPGGGNGWPVEGHIGPHANMMTAVSANAAQVLAVAPLPAAQPASGPAPSRTTYMALRNVAERILAAALLVGLMPLMISFFAIIKVTSEGPGLFWSRRVGRNGRHFAMPKFRTMFAGTDLVPREKMSCLISPVTPFGRWLRRWSLDELPQLWSILVGDMSFIGPRPLIPHDEAQHQRDLLGLAPDVRPGLTGLAQINGRNHVLPRAKARYDVFYGQRVSPWLDWMILRRTVQLVIRGTGIW